MPKQRHKDAQTIVAAIVKSQLGGKPLAMSILDVVTDIRKEAFADAFEWLNEQTERYEGSTYAALKCISEEFKTGARAAECSFCRAARLGIATISRTCTCPKQLAYEAGAAEVEARIDNAIRRYRDLDRKTLVRYLRVGDVAMANRILLAILTPEL